jgi:hypothetical protein
MQEFVKLNAFFIFTGQQCVYLYYITLQEFSSFSGQGKYRKLIPFKNGSKTHIFGK